MSKSAIEWTQETWNPVVGCSICTTGCTRCYAMGQAARIEAFNAAAREKGKAPPAPQYDGTTKKVNGTAVWTGKLALAGDNILLQPLKRKKPTTYFVNSMGDLFHEDCPDEWIDRVFAVMALCPQHTFQVLTKRAARMREYLTNNTVRDSTLRAGAVWPLPNVWAGVSTERQQEADERIPELLRTPAAVRFISYEPGLGPVDLRSTLGGTQWIGGQRGCGGHHRGNGSPECPRELHHHHDERCGPGLDWVIVGGESGPGARPMHPDWARSLRDQCAAAGVAFFFKQLGNWKPDLPEGSALRGTNIAWPDGRVGHGCAEDHGGPGVFLFNVGKSRAGRLLDGIEHNGMPDIHNGDHRLTPARRSAPA